MELHAVWAGMEAHKQTTKDGWVHFRVGIL